MNEREMLLKRVADDAEQIAKLTRGGLNFPLGEYLDEASLNALCDSMGLEPDQWSTSDLERILVLREGLYKLRHTLRDKGDDQNTEHSVEQILGALDRLYVDLERALLQFGQLELAEAQKRLAAIREGPRVASSEFSAPVRNLQQAATELLTQAHITQRSIEINIIRVDQFNVNLDVLKNAKLNVQRLSASVFAIKLSLEQSIIFQGIFELLNDGADSVLAELKSLVREIQKTYSQAKDFLAQLSKLSETGGRFVKLISTFLQQIFGDDPIPERSIDLQQLAASEEGEALLCGANVSSQIVLCGGRNGACMLLQTSSMRLISNGRFGQNDINSVSDLGDGFVAFGRADGFVVLDAVENRSHPPSKLSPFWHDEYVLNHYPRHIKHPADHREQINAVQRTEWMDASGDPGTIVTGGESGMLRRWSESNASEEKSLAVGRSIRRIREFGSKLIVATAEKILIVNREMEIQASTNLQFTINDFDILDETTLIVCGSGGLAHVNLAKGSFTRLISSSANVNYTSVINMGRGCICLGTDKGNLLAVDFNSGEEIGSIKLAFQIRGLISLDTRVLVYGGGKGSKECAAFVSWREQKLVPNNVG